jgi:hypothetical protein
MPGLPYQALSVGSPSVSPNSRELQDWIVEFGYRMGFALCWQLGGQPVTPKTVTSVGESQLTSWTNQTINADVTVRVKTWSPDIVASTPSVNCFEPSSGSFPNWYRFSLTVDPAVRNAFKAMTPEECPYAHLIYDFPETTFVASDELSRMNNVSGYVSHNPPLDSQKHQVTTRVNGKVCEARELYSGSMVTPPPAQYLNGAKSYDGKFMGIKTIQFRQVCETGEESVGCMVLTYFLVNIGH